MKIANHGPDLASLQELVDTVPALIHTARPDGYIDFFNQRWLEFVGLRLADLEGWKWAAAVHPDDVDALVAKWRTSIASGEPFECESRVRRADGAYRWMWHQKLPLRNASGEIVKWYGSSVDIDDRKQAEYDVRKHETVHVTLEAQLQATLNIIPAYTWYAAPSGALTFVNERCADYLGLPSDHPLRFGLDTGAAWDAHIPLLHPDDREHSRSVWSTCLRTGSAAEISFRVRSAAGTYRWFLSRVEPLRAHDGTLLYWIGINLDIEERKQAEFYLAEGQRLAHTGSWAFNAAGFGYWSPELFAMYGLDPHSTPPSTQEYLALVHVDDREFVAQEIQTVLAEQREFDFTNRIVRPDGSIRHIRWVGTPAASGGVFQGFVGTGIDVTEHELLTRELRRREAYLAEAQSLSHTGTFGWRPDSGEIVWSAETYRIFGYDEGITPTLDLVVQRVHPEDRAEFQKVVDAASLAAAAHFEHTYRLLLPGERVKHVHALARRMADAFDSHEFVGAITDVTEHKRDEDALRESEEQFRLVVDSIAGLVATLTPGGEVDFVNKQVFDYFGKTLDELKNWRMSDAVHPGDLDRVAALWANTIANGQPYDVEYRLRRSDGMYRWFHARGRPLRDAEGAIARWYVLLTDIDERKQAEQRLKEQEAELRQILDLSHQLVGVLGPARERLYVNQTALDYLGVSLDEWRQRGPGVSIHPEDVDRLYAHADRASSTGAAYEVEARVRKYDGSYRWFQFRFNPVRDEEGQITRWYWACTDIEDRKRAQERLEQENVALREEIDKASMFEEIVGASSALKALLSRVSKVAGSDSTVLITGETGTGKELVARAIHRRSRRAARAFVAVNCAAIPRDLIASELFGHEKGAFTGAVQRRLGRFELADGGTIFLDEVGELSSDTQVSLLRVLQEREFERVGGRQPIHVDVRVIAATNRDLNAAVAAGTFRQDLYYRLNVFPLEMPPLRERREDIPVLVEYFIDRYARKAGKTIRRVNKRTLDRLQSYPWPGNVRELQNVIERSVIVCETDEFTVDGSWLSAGPAVENRLALSSTLAGHEKTIIEDALRASGGRVFGPSGAAARLGIARSTLESKIRALGINKNRFRARAAKP
jgi:formate hydrogenlyase transcriptional activator